MLADIDDKVNSGQFRILVVDDQPTMRHLIREAVNDLGYGCLEAADGIEALEILEKEPMDLVITDISMPRLDGIALTQAIKGKYDSNVIVMTGMVGNFTYEDIIAKGASDFVLKPVRIQELLVRIKRVLRERIIIAERNRIENDLRESEGRYHELSITDNLTKLYNSRHFYNQLATEINRSVRYNRSISLMMLDVDDFKKYNDSFGHLEGDGVLIRLAKVIRSGMRRLDQACRYGGEEFVVILPETTGEQGYLIAERIREGFRQEIFTPAQGRDTHVTVSIGVAQLKPQEDMMHFVDRADKNMYAAKAAGKDKVIFA
ncbi:MAG TPA: diguanylate cyclase response regulator [Syntrophus sp. (in: bacteria)]|jgi:diguanylate cyclase (GGDEF)-like protein|nr:diguanylate cyclase response regulator [Syntrophus sp. (in: bacteria)]